MLESLFGKWVSVKDHPLPIDQYMLVTDGASVMLVCMYGEHQYQHFAAVGIESSDYLCALGPPQVTHWQPVRLPGGAEE